MCVFLVNRALLTLYPILDDNLSGLDLFISHMFVCLFVLVMFSKTRFYFFYI